MTKNILILGLVSAAVVTLMLINPRISQGQGDGGEIPFSVASVFFELNNTDGDLGIHALVDGEPWKSLTIENADERTLLNIKVRSRLRHQGLTELFFESAEPTFDELPPDTFFRRFPEGEYEVEGRTLDGLEMEGSSELTHLLPAPPANIRFNNQPAPEDCDKDPIPVVSGPIVVTWDPVTLSHPDLGRTGEPIEVVQYELVFEAEDEAPLKLTVLLPPTASQFELPAAFTDGGGEFKFEILVREASGNQTAVETCFEAD